VNRAFIASFLGWTLDAYDFFLVVVVVPHLADDFHRSVATVTAAVTLTLAMRPVGALVFGWLADRYGRRVPLMVDIGLYSLFELLTAFAPSFTVLLVLRALFGIAMGGEWGLGAALAMESLPARRRGIFSGMLQQGYAVGYLLAALTLALLYTHIGWRGMFALGVLPALLILYIRKNVPESPTWKAGTAAPLALRPAAMIASLRRYGVLFAYGMLLMAAFNFMSHGSQDPYATFLTKQLKFSPGFVGSIAAITMVGAIAGGTFFGWLSQRIGRRIAIVIGALAGAALIPAWAFNHTAAALAAGGFFMQFMVQGAWGIVPAHLNELAPPGARGTFPGFTYQLGNLIAAGTLQIESMLAAHRFLSPSGPNYAMAMAFFMVFAFAGVIVMALLGYAVSPERRQEPLASLHNP
jgi:SHS family lactate transporter-like MFS transporter